MPHVTDWCITFLSDTLKPNNDKNESEFFLTGLYLVYEIRGFHHGKIYENSLQLRRLSNFILSP